MIAVVECPKCGSSGKVDVGEVKDMAEAQAVVDKHMGSCPWGQHIELTAIKGFKVLSLEEGSAPTMEDYLASQGEKYDLWVLYEDQAKELGVNSVVASGIELEFPGYCKATVDGKDLWMDYTDATPAGKRIYYSRKGAFKVLTGRDPVQSKQEQGVTAEA